MVKDIYLFPFLVLIVLTTVIWSCGEPQSKELQWQQVSNDLAQAAVYIPNQGSAPLFESVNPSASGIQFQNLVDRASIIDNENVLNGSGVSLGDINGDGLVDIYFTGMDADNQLYLNRGNWKFEDITASSGTACKDIWSTGTTMVDGDGDGDLDIFVSTLGYGLIHFINDGTGSFSKNDLGAFVHRKGGTTMSFSDYDKDGDLDLYLANYKYRSLRDSLPAHTLSNENLVRIDAKGKRYIRKEFAEDYMVKLINDGTNTIEQVFELGEPDILYVNQGNNNWVPADIGQTFKDLEGQPMNQLPKGWGLSVQFRDINGDGWSDIYVCNDYETPDNFWINKEGVFHEIDPLALRHGSNSSMSVDFSDLNQDGDLDFFVSEMLSTTHTRRKTQMGIMAATPISIGVYDDLPQYMRNTLFVSRGDGTFTETARYSHLSSSEWSWSSIFKDIDFDGDDDLVVSTGHLYDFMDSDAMNKVNQMPQRTLTAFKETRFEFPPLELNNLVFENKGDLHFELMKSGGDFGIEADVSHGMAMADLDNDGDQDIVVNRLGKVAGIFRNNSDGARVGITLTGDKGNKQAIGAQILVQSEGQADQMKQVVAGGRYLSADDLEKEFAAFDKDGAIDVQVTWPDGQISEWKGLSANHKYSLSKANAKARTTSNSKSMTALFEPFEGAYTHKHQETAFNDFIVQSLLPNRMSQFGPGVAVADVNNDGRDDITISDGRGGKLRQYLSAGSGFKEKIIGQTNKVDQLGVLVLSGAQGSQTIAANVNLEAKSKSNSSLNIFSSSGEDLTQLGIDMAGGISAADYDGDGDLDLFIQGRAKPYMYPAPASSYFLKNENGSWLQDGINTYNLKELGMVTGSVFSDMDSDGDPDLLLSLEWGGVQYYENVKGEFKNVSEAQGLNKWSGWWNGITTGDFNNDGLLDIVATNWGLNSKYHLSADKPLQLFFKDFDNNRSLDVIEAHYDDDFGDFVPERGFSCMSNAMPFIAEEKGTFKNYATSDLDGILGNRLQDAEKLEANELQTGVFINTGNGFEFNPLPMEAQLTTAMSPVVFDANGDGNQDILLSQNFFAVQRETDRNDGGRGLLLLGNGTGDFQSIPGQQSGVKVYGEQRGSAYGDFNNDNKPDIIITQNGAESVILTNTSTNDFARIRLRGDSGNSSAIGAQVQATYKDGKKGPIYEVKAGEGMLSQSSSDLYIGAIGRISKLDIYFKGQKVNTISDLKEGLNIIEL